MEQTTGEGEMWKGVAVYLVAVVLALVLPVGSAIGQPEKSAVVAKSKLDPSWASESSESREARTSQPCDPPTDLRTSDLCAQWKAADAANKAAIAADTSNKVAVAANEIAKWSIGLTFIAVIGAILSAWYSRRTLHAERAWMTPNIPYAGYEGPITLAMERLLPLVKVVVEWKNTGRSPAVCVAAIVRTALVSISDPVPVFPREFSKPGMLIGLNNYVRPESITLNVGQVHDLWQGESVLYVFSRCTYRDVFSDVSRETTMCHRLRLWLHIQDEKKWIVTSSVEAIEDQHSWS